MEIPTVIDFFKQRGISLTREQARLFLVHKNFLQQENKRINLTRITEEARVLEEHFWDSVACLDQGRSFTGSTLLDVGTGAGFPGVPIKILIPEVQLTLMEPAGRRAAYLRQLARELSLEGIEVIQHRAEEFGRNKGREIYAWVVARALAPLVTGVELALPLVQVNGFFWAYKGRDYQQELDEARTIIARCGGILEAVMPYQLPGESIDRNVLVFKKEKPAETAFPRKSGMPQKRPLY